MNNKLVESLVQIIDSLSSEEQTVLIENIKAKKTQQNRQRNYQKLLKLKTLIFGHRSGTTIQPTPEKIIDQMREERTETLIKASFPESYQSNSQE
ncbi:hypothetical protein [Gloeocapsa sp. PCC 73106]|uniref:hypothetical protein n=1 Tax=Gloeocapsa sp. PCC 73106 TaxID=102232 RepID=UPI0002AC1FD7|nr:hypothetical protein [Gloeocapsa sp. PCC 73106]ELS00241.1 hypothetical protein GLO73106DRAFT_00040970 [Gloeocapsa sp. PCC 73106]